jgi:methylase of polypeptide subunit release factors
MGEPKLDATDAACLRQALTAAGYTSAGLADSAGGPEPGTPLDTLLQVFEYGRTVPAARLRKALAPLTLDRAAAAGIIEKCPDGGRGALYIQPYHQWWVLADPPARFRRGPLRKDHVVEVGQVPAVLARAVVRDPVRSALDLCCGSGVQSLLLSGHAEAVTGADLNPRALTFAAATAALNGVDWRLICGNLMEPVAGQQFDLVVSNPPFIIRPGGVDYLYRDAGLPGDQLGAHLAAAAPGLLNAGGYMQYMASWVHISGQDWTERVASWIAGTGMDAWIIQLDIQEPADYVRAWSADPGAPIDRAWFDWLRQQHVEAISCGLITLRNVGRADAVIRADDLAGHDVLGSDVSAWFSRHDWLRDHDLLACHFRAVDGLRLQSTSYLHGGAWQNDRHQLTTPAGPRRTDQVSDLIVAIVAACDGKLPVGEQLAKLAAQLGVGSAELRAAAIPAITELIEHHVIEPAPDR